MEKLKQRLKNWLGITAAEERTQQLIDAMASWNLAELRDRINDIEASIPGLDKAKAAEEAKPLPLIPGHIPYTQRKRNWEASRRKPQAK